MNVLYSKNEVDRFGGASERSTILPNGTYYGSNTIYHNLHCLVSWPEDNLCKLLVLTVGTAALYLQVLVERPVLPRADI